MSKVKITVKIKQRAPRTEVKLRPKAQNISRKKYNRDKSWKAAAENE